jgi:regulator of protease activity HflC (stomatin/prohibitin superfamily)
VKDLLEAVKRFSAWIGHGVRRSFAWVVLAVVFLARHAWRGVLAFFRSRPVRFTGRTTLATVRVGLWTALFGGVALAAGWLGYKRIPPGMVGVKQSNFGGGGIEMRDYPSGLHFGPMFIDEWHLVDRTTQVLMFAWESEGGDHPMLEVRTKDGNIAHVGVAVPYRLKAGEAAELVRDGAKHVWKQRVRTTVEKVLLQEFAAFSSDSLCSTDERAARVAETLPKLNQLLAVFHVEAESIQIMQVMFGLEYEKKLQQKQLTRQTALLSSATTAVDEQRKENRLFQEEIDASEKLISNEADQAIARRYAEGRAKYAEVFGQAREYDRLRKAEAQAEHDKLVAEGDRALLKVEQTRQELANEIHDSAGGRLMLAKKAAENLNIHRVTLNSNDPRVPSVLDLDELVKILVGRGEE